MSVNGAAGISCYGKAITGNVHFRVIWDFTGIHGHNTAFRRQSQRSCAAGACAPGISCRFRYNFIPVRFITFQTAWAVPCRTTSSTGSSTRCRTSSYFQSPFGPETFAYVTLSLPVTPGLSTCFVPKAKAGSSTNRVPKGTCTSSSATTERGPKI